MSADNDLVGQNRLCVEVGWEVCNQLGGIYTVLRSKTPVAMNRFGDHYCLIGTYNAKFAAVEFEESPRTGYYGKVCEILEKRGIVTHFGRWIVSGNPQVILIDYLRSFSMLKDYKYYLWKDHQIESVDDQEVNDVILFGYLVAELLDELCTLVQQDPAEDKPELPLLVHFHEWMAGIPIPVIGKRRLPIASIFTTHATLLGRYLASDDPNFYNYLSWIDADGAAKARGIYPRFAIERAAACGATTFTTVSSITASEAEQFLQRKPDSILPNGLNIQRFAALHEFQNLHQLNKQKIHEFVMGHFFPSYTFDLDKTLYLFTAGRYEYRNKGLDLFIESLARLNYQLQQEKPDVTVVAFIITKGATKGYNVEVLKSQKMFAELRKNCEAVSDVIDRRLIERIAHGQFPTLENLIVEHEALRLKRMMHAWKREKWQLPTIVTHDMQNDASDPVLTQLRTCNLINRPEDRVKIVFHPEFLTATSPLIGLDYDQFVRGCHLGVFPSYYEPWGYTPMECAMLGVPSISSDLAGFGTHVINHIPDYEKSGFFIVERRYKDFHQSADHLAYLMKLIVKMSRRERIELRNRVESMSEHFDWKSLYHFYREAQQTAMARYFERQNR